MVSLNFLFQESFVLKSKPPLAPNAHTQIVAPLKFMEINTVMCWGICGQTYKLQSMYSQIVGFKIQALLPYSTPTIRVKNRP